MKTFSFKNGIHVNDEKERTKDVAIKEILPKEELVFPMQQHIGAQALPIVEVGDRILVGQKIGEAQGKISANIISSVSGTVTGIEKRLTVSGEKILSVVVKNDQQYQAVEGFGIKQDYTKLSNQEIQTLIGEAGIVGLGGAGFPTEVKLNPKNEMEITHVLVNGAECEPYLTSDYRIMLEEPELIIGGTKVLLKLFPNAVAIIGIEDNKREAFDKLQELALKEEKIHVVLLKTKYPQGAERQFIYATTGKKINSSRLPAELGCVLNNIETVRAICLAVCNRTKLVERIITVSGEGIKNPGNFKVRLGMNHKEIIEGAGGYEVEPEKILSGGPMMGMALITADFPVVKTSSALISLKEDEVNRTNTSSCIRCGRCVNACPCYLIPQKMHECAKRMDEEGYQKLYGMECYECGSCTYVCPAKIKLTQSFKLMRRSIHSKKVK